LEVKDFSAIPRPKSAHIAHAAHSPHTKLLAPTFTSAAHPSIHGHLGRDLRTPATYARSVSCAHPSFVSGPVRTPILQSPQLVRTNRPCAAHCPRADPRERAQCRGWVGIVSCAAKTAYDVREGRRDVGQAGPLKEREAGLVVDGVSYGHGMNACPTAVLLSICHGHRLCVVPGRSRPYLSCSSCTVCG
jgi:hypothetical protein